VKTFSELIAEVEVSIDDTGCTDGLTVCDGDALAALIDRCKDVDAELTLLYRKISHGCADFACSECDNQGAKP